MIDLRSDTVTKPNETLRRLMAEADVGDDVYGEDPSVNELERYVAELVQKESSLFVTSGTQGNQAAILAHTRPGDEIIMDRDAHVFIYEGAAMSVFAGVQAMSLPHTNGEMNLDEVERSIRSDDIHFPETGLIWLENTHNRGGGAVLSLSYMKELYTLAQRYEIPVHMDGARLFNAAASLQVEPSEITQYVDTVQFCLSKGLGAPVGSMLAGPAPFIKRARKVRKMLGGGLRQAGVLAAPGLYALKHHREQLHVDHQHAQKIAEALRTWTDLTIDHEVQTNIVVANVAPSKRSVHEWVDLFEEKGVRIIPYKAGSLRFTTNRDVSKEDIEQVIKVIQELGAS
ncbi:low-specificity L-threonine aldolase [Paenalkalicoccus suaedae]|uniref:Low-specificity L-threonine aldolase n=1 Tax=Paenalkalicoccus suaedae TaxID=2592382 RepID=A0A859FIP6_9BACI|nr:low-specificity L-threonine aldolase [Paenalkalicoccus suaedae]QKS72125.1 low-specificity L-threonine aldolase [Paenalkalicoccus suaedae]